MTSSFITDATSFSLFPLNTTPSLPHEHITVGNNMYARCTIFFYSVRLEIKRNHSAGSKAWVCGCSLAGITGSNPSEDMGLSLAHILCCQVEVSAKGRSIIQRSPPETEWETEKDRERERESVCVCVSWCVCVCVIECDQVQQQHSTPTISR